MNYNLPYIQKDNIFKRIIKKIKSFFVKNTETEINYSSTYEKRNFVKNIKTTAPDINKTEYSQKELLHTVKENPKVLERLSNERLEIFLKYLLNEIKKNDKIIAKFKNA